MCCSLFRLWTYTNTTGLKPPLSVFPQPKEQMLGEAELERGLVEVTRSQHGAEPNVSLELTQNLGFLQQAKLTERALIQETEGTHGES